MVPFSGLVCYATDSIHILHGPLAKYTIVQVVPWDAATGGPQYTAAPFTRPAQAVSKQPTTDCYKLLPPQQGKSLEILHSSSPAYDPLPNGPVRNKNVQQNQRQRQVIGHEYLDLYRVKCWKFVWGCRLSGLWSNVHVCLAYLLHFSSKHFS